MTFLRSISLSSLCIVAPAMMHAGEPLPPPSPHQPPQPKEEGAARTWAEKYEDRRRHWCFQPVTRPAIPPVRDQTWPRNDIDRFILAKLEASGLKPAPRATPGALARRLSFALTGLPSRPGDLALDYQTLVDQLLASPHFGEHWARHWMDVVRYAETFGSEHDYLNPYAWRYRDYLVRACNADVPYDRFIQEQLAGDLLPDPRINPVLGINESLLGTAFQRMSEFYGAPVDVLREKATVIDWQIETVGKAFLGLTIACARCHDHKFDPISGVDYYALGGVFEGARPVQNIVDAPGRLTSHDGKLLELKRRIREEAAARWLATPIAMDDLQKALASAKKDTPFASLREGTSPPPCSRSLVPLPPLTTWHQSGPGVPGEPSPPGSLSLHPSGASIVRAIQLAGWYSDAATMRHDGSLRSPEFTLAKRNVSVLVTGSGDARLRLVVEGCQADIVLFKPANKDVSNAAPAWVTLRTREQWQGLRAHVEIMTHDVNPTVGTVKDARKWESGRGTRSAFGVIDAVQHEDGEQLPPLRLPDELGKARPDSGGAFTIQFNKVVRAALNAWRQGSLTDPQALLLQSCLDAGLLRNEPQKGSAIEALLVLYRETESRIPAATLAPGVQDDRTGHDVPVLFRGDPHSPGNIVPRRMPAVLGGGSVADSLRGDRLALAAQLARAENPLTARVMVNRVWHHLFGRGLVATTDNFGRAGERPSHPELLDHLATQFVQQGWSVKRLIRDIVMSQTWQTAADPPDGAAQRDPGNLLLSHANARRLDAESIRDNLLAVAGDLDPALGGPSIYNHYRESVDPDKQPPSGPLDGGRRRSIYLEVRRNFLNDFLTCFDFPRPNNPTGARSITNVPAQSIALLNDPFVLHEAVVWGKRIAATAGTDRQRIERMHLEAFGRPPTPDEMSRSLSFLQGSGGDWSQLAHAMFNMKEFIFVP